ncbi:protein of unknown function [Cyanobium sp. NIES-981]|nr:protein of unknown function [Cyanobium sp. NIES-981]
MSGCRNMQSPRQGSSQHPQVMACDQPAAERLKQMLCDALGFDPANIKGILMGQGVVIEQLHGHRRREFLGRLEQAHQQGGPQEVIDHPVADAKPHEECLRVEVVVVLKYPIAAIEIEDGVEKPCNAQPIPNRQAFEVGDGGQHLTQGTRPLGRLTEHRSRGLQAIGRPERTGGEAGVDAAHIELFREGIDVGIILPEASGSRFKGFAAFRGDGLAAGGVGHPIDQRHTNAGFTQPLGGAPASPAGSDDNHMRASLAGRGVVWHRSFLHRTLWHQPIPCKIRKTRSKA